MQTFLKHHNKKKGFTLIEVMVAMSIMAFIVPSLIMLMAQQADNADSLRNKAIATWIAENTLTRLRLDRELNDTLLRAPLEETVSMVDMEWLVVTEPEQTEQGTLLIYRTQVSSVDDESDAFTTLTTYIR